VAIIDWYARYVVSWALDDTLEIDFVLDTCEMALKAARPEIMNSDQGSHFTSPQYTKLFLDAKVRISMDHRGRAYDNIFVERLWRTVKYENIYLQDYENPREARQGITKYLYYYNNKRLHQSLGNQTPADVYFGRIGNSL
jgi:putative transposase